MLAVLAQEERDGKPEPAKDIPAAGKSATKEKPATELSEPIFKLPPLK